MSNVIKDMLNKCRIVVFLKRRIWHLLNLNGRFDSYTDRDYFARAFKHDKNFNSLGFEDGIVVGSFKDINYLMKLRPLDFIETNIFISGAWELHLLTLMAAYLNHKGKGVMIDVGANVGASTIPLAKYFPNIEFHLYEPHPSVFERLQENLSINKLGNVHSKKLAVSDVAADSVSFYAQKKSSNNGLSGLTVNYDTGDYDEIQVRSVRLDDDFCSIEIPVKVIKIDVQGAELKVLKSASEIIKKHRPVIFFEYESRYFHGNEEELVKKQMLAFFEEHNYQLVYVPDSSKYLPSLKISSYFQGDILAIPNQ